MGSDHSSSILETATPAGNTDCNRDGQTNVIDLVCLNNLIATSTPPAEIINSTYFAYDLRGQLIGEYDNNGNPIQETVYFGNIPVATVKNNTVYYIHTDQLNTPRAISDVNNITLWQWASTPFGETAANEDVDGDGNSFGYHLRFPGQYFDQETGTHYNVMRDYDPAIGRYIQSDRIGLQGGLNTYVYVESDPLSFFDPNGLDKKAGSGNNKNLIDNMSDLIDPPGDFYWETPVTQGGCVMGWFFNYKWKCKTKKPPSVPNMCLPHDSDPDEIEVTTTKPKSPAGDCKFIGKIAVEFGLVCPSQTDNVTTPPQQFWEKAK